MDYFLKRFEVSIVHVGLHEIGTRALVHIPQRRRLAVPEIRPAIAAHSRSSVPRAGSVFSCPKGTDPSYLVAFTTSWHYEIATSPAGSL
jgi:hypothetical protein